eukprot:IDg2300t1
MKLRMGNYILSCFYDGRSDDSRSAHSRTTL